MSRWINVSPPLTDKGIQLGVKAVASRAYSRIMPIQQFPFFIGKPFPVGNSGMKSMGQINKLLFLEDKPRVVQGMRSIRCTAKNSCK